MSATIKSGASADLLTVDPTSKAGRVTLYRPDGSEIYRQYAGIYRLPIEIIPTTLTINSTYFAMRNTGTRRAFVRLIDVSLGFAGTAALSRGIYSLHRFGSATPTGGTGLAIIKTRNSWPTSSIGDARFAPGGLTTTSVVFEGAAHLLPHTNQVTVDRQDEINHAYEDEDWWIELAVNEGLCIRAYTALVAGSFLAGSLLWAERT